MRKLNFQPMILALAAVSTLAAACGELPARRALGASARNLGELSRVNRVAAEQLLFVQEGQKDGASTASCIAARGVLFAKREALGASSDYRNLANTEDHKRLVNNLENYNAVSCDPEDGRAECVELRSKIASDVEKVTLNPEWVVLTKNDQFRDVASKYSDAVREGCIAAKNI